MALKFLVDANVFIQAAKEYYSFDLAPGFWTALEQHIQAGTVSSIDKIAMEIEKGNDELTEWFSSHLGPQLLKSDDPAVITEFARYMTWVNSQAQFLAGAKTEFAEVADGWLIAMAKVKGVIVVTDEVFNKDIRKKVKMPNVCQKFDVPYLNTYGFLRALGVKLK